MALTAGTRLGAYEVVALLGAGGMGEVYRARDTRLDRTVAIKVLPSDVASTRELRERFEREARTVAALNHPHICTLHDVGRHEDVDFLVMEYLEGETLQQRLERGALPLDHALQIAVQVADALAAAHRAGVVHRDLKPGNIFLLGRKSAEGRRGGSSGPPLAKLLDFGLAKPASPVAAGPVSMLPTTPRGLTVQGTILGTFQYMAPEQLEGLEADARTDIFAFGAVLYEMLARRKAFEGKSQASLIAAILEHESTPISTVRPDVPRQLEHVVRRCLAKSPDERWQTAADLYRELKWTSEGTAKPWPGAQTAPRRRSGWRTPVPFAVEAGVAVVTALLVGVVAWSFLRGGDAPGPRVARLSIVLPPGDEVADPQGTAVAVSPDGSCVAYVASSGGRDQLFLRDIAAHETRSVGGTDAAKSPFFSPDGQWIGFFAQGMLRKVSVSSGAVQTLTEAPFGVGGSWSEDGRIYFAAMNTGGLSNVSADGGAAIQVTQLDRVAGEVSHRWPHVLPGGRALMFEVWTGPAPDENRIDVLRLDTGDRSVVVRGGTSGRYTPTGHVIYARREELYALPFDTGRLEASGQAVRLRDRPRYGGEGSHFAVSASGALAYVAGGPQRDERRLVWVSRGGSVNPLPAPARPYVNVALSPDGRRAATDIIAGTVEIWVYDFARVTLTRLTTGTGSSQGPRWTPDGARIAYRATRTGFRNVWWKTVDETTVEERLTTSEHVQTPSSWSADGWLIYSESDPKSGADIWALPGSGDRKPRVVARTAGFDSYARLSPDGRWLAYASNESGRDEVFVQLFPGPGVRVQISSDGGIEPLWSRDGRELFYRNGDRMMAVDMMTTPALKAGTPRVLFEGRFVPSPNGVTGYDVAADGRFLMVQPLHPDPPTNQIQVVLNWFDELRRLGN